MLTAVAAQSQPVRLSGLQAALAAFPFPSLRLLLLLSAAVRVASILVMRNYLHPETFEFGQYTGNLLSGYGYRFMGLPSAFHPPGYPLILAFFLRVFGGTSGTYLLLELFEAAFGVLLVYGVYALARALYRDVVTAKIAALIAALLPGFIYTCNEFHSISFYLVLTTASVFYLVRALAQPDDWSPLCLSAIYMGLLLWFRSEAIVLAFLLAALLPLRRGRARLLRPVVYLLIAWSALVPWTVRNYRVFHIFLPTTTGGGISLWIGNNPHANGSDRDAGGYMLSYLPPAMLAELQAIPRDTLNEIRQDKLYRQVALTYIRSHPGREFVLALEKLWLYFTVDPNHDKGRNPVYWLPSLGLTILAVLGLFLGERPPLYALSPLLVTIFFGMLLAVVLLALPRYRMAIDPFLCVLAANSAAFLLRALVRQRGRTAVSAAAV